MKKEADEAAEEERLANEAAEQAAAKAAAINEIEDQGECLVMCNFCSFSCFRASLW